MRNLCAFKFKCSNNYVPIFVKTLNMNTQVVSRATTVKRLAFFMCHFSFFVIAESSCTAQNKIYLENEERKGSVIEFTTTAVKYKNPDNPGPVYSVQRNKVQLLFNENGSFLLPAQLDSIDKRSADNLVNAFINYRKATNPDDRIYTTKKKLLNCTILKEDEKTLLISINNIEFRMEKDIIACIVYRSGEHKLIAAPGILLDVLSAFQLSNEKNNETVKNTPPKKDPVKKAEPINAALSDEDIARRKDSISSMKLLEQERKQLISERQEMIRDSMVVVKQYELERKVLIAERKEQIRDSLAAVETNNRKYTEAINSGKNFLQDSNYANAKIAYAEATAIKPDERYPLEQLILIDAKLEEIRQALELQQRFDSLISQADSQNIAKSWYTALDIYKRALVLKSNDYYTQKQISYVEAEILQKETDDKIRAEKRKKQEQEDKYTKALARAEEAVKEKKYSAALDAYNEALSIHPENEYAQSRAKIMQYQVSIQKNNN